MDSDKCRPQCVIHSIQPGFCQVAHFRALTCRPNAEEDARYGSSKRQDNATEPCQSAIQQRSKCGQSPRENLPVWLLALSTRLFILPEAWDGWATIHAKPYQVFLYTMLASFVAIVVNSWCLSVASKLVSVLLLIPCMVYCICHLAVHVLVWRYGPAVSQNTPYTAMGCLSGAAHAFVTVRLLAWQGQHIPFGSHLRFLACLAAGMWALRVAAVLGIWGMDHAPKPHRYVSFAFVETVLVTTTSGCSCIGAIVTLYCSMQSRVWS